MDEKTRQELLKEMSEEELKRYEEEIKIEKIKHQKREEIAKAEKAKFIKMSREDKLKLCRFYKGQKSNPYKRPDLRRLFWTCEELFIRDKWNDDIVFGLVLVNKEIHKQINIIIAARIRRYSHRAEGSDELSRIFDQYLSMKP